MIVLVDSAAKRVWDFFQAVFKSAFVLRTGYTNHGVAKPLSGHGKEGDCFYYRGESDLEHQAKAAALFISMKMNFPKFTDHAPQWEIYGNLENMSLMLFHDIGEIETGDVADDGNSNISDKNAVEREVFQSIIEEGLGLEMGGDLVKKFINFQDRSSDQGKALYAINKLEAVLTLVALESYESVGSAKKKLKLTKQDEKCIEFAGTDNPTDCFAVHLKANIDDYPENIREPIYAVLREAVVDVRGSFFEWWEKGTPVL